jgi:hypothetical protein
MLLRYKTYKKIFLKYDQGIYNLYIMMFLLRINGAGTGAVGAGAGDEMYPIPPKRWSCL